MSTPKLTLSMIVKNEANRYLAQVLQAHRTYIDQAVIIDDGSTDETVQLCRELLDGIPLLLIENPASKFANEVELRKQQWDATVSTQPGWILNLDADEVFEDAFGQQVRGIIAGSGHDAVYFRLYDMWSQTQYREDLYWQAHRYYRPFLLRYRSDFTYRWLEKAQHCGRFPANISEFSYLCHPLRLKHYGWARAEDRRAKYERYMLLDKDARYGWKEQYESILDEHPHLVDWQEA